MKNFESFLAPQLSGYLIYRQGLGYSIKLTRHCLLVFDRYLKKTNAQWDTLTPFFFLEMRADLEMEPCSVNKVISTVRVFCQFLVRREYLDQNPLRDVPLLKENSVIPFVFSRKQTEQLLEAVCRGLRRSKPYFLTDLAHYLAVVLMARCGMRISEPLKLMMHHYSRDDATLYIERTKFKKHRLIPIPKAVFTEIENYLAVRERFCPNDQNPYLLSGKGHHPIRDYRIRSFFHKAVKQIGLDQARHIIGHVNFSQPTPHSLRHSFAVNTLLNIKDRGQSPQHALPVLAAYMGHTLYKYTSVYLRVMDAMSRKNLADFSLWHQRKQ
jgi:integrase